MATNLYGKIFESGLYSPLFVALAFENGLQYRTSDLKRFFYYDLAASFKRLLNFGSVTPEFRWVKCVHFFVDQQVGYVRLMAPVLEFAGISTEFSEMVTTQLCFTYTLAGVSATLSRLHSRSFIHL